jgi:hypothetical protein
VLQQSRLVVLSLLCVLFGIFAWWVLAHTGMLRRLGHPMDEVARFVAMSPCLIGVVLAAAGLRWDGRKGLARMALVASLVAAGFLILTGR